MVFGYARVSTEHQRIIRQITNIKEAYGNIPIYKEFYTGTTLKRPEWDKLLKVVQEGDTIVFDSVSRMSRNAVDGFNTYKSLFLKGVSLVFLNEPLINTSVFESAKKNLQKVNVDTGNKAINTFLKNNIDNINDLLMSLAEEQIKEAFKQSEKEVEDLHKRITEGMREAKNLGKSIGLKKGTKLTTKKEKSCLEIIKKHSKDFNGTLEDRDVITLCGCSRNSYYKYKKSVKINKT